MMGRIIEHEVYIVMEVQVEPIVKNKGGPQRKIHILRKSLRQSG